LCSGTACIHRQHFLQLYVAVAVGDGIEGATALNGTRNLLQYMHVYTRSCCDVAPHTMQAVGGVHGGHTNLSPAERAAKESGGGGGGGGGTQGGAARE
jgi:hypothetical protein